MNLKDEYGAILRDWREGFSRDVRECGISFVLILLLAFGAALLFAPLRESIMDIYTQAVEGSGILEAEGGFSFGSLFANNVVVCFSVCIYGLIPFIRFPALALGFNAAGIGVVAAQFLSEGLSMGLFFAALLPHGIFELPALVLTLSMGLRLCRHSTALVRKQTKEPLWVTLGQFGRLYMMVILPLLLVSAAMETWVTPHVMALFQ